MAAPILLLGVLSCAPSSTQPSTTQPSTTQPSTTQPAPAPSQVDASNGRLLLTHGPLLSFWVDPAQGNDASSGSSAQSPLRSVSEAWRRVPASATLTQGYRILLQPGTYPSSLLPNYMEYRWGTAQSPIIIQAAQGLGTAKLTGDLNVFETRHLYLVDLEIDRNGDAFHCERCSNILIRKSRLWGGTGAHETVKVNQSSNIYIEDSDIGGADDNAIDFVAVHTGHLRGNKIHTANDWCAYAKGGSAGIVVDGNEIYDCGTGGFTAGQGTGFEFMQAPWLQYEAYGITVTNNVIHDTDGAGLGVNGGYNVVMAYNTLYRIGSRSHAVEFVHGSRSCDGDSSACSAHRSAGGWGDSGEGGQYIPNKHIVFANNVIYNPAPYETAWQHFTVAGPSIPPNASGAPSPALADDDLRIFGNVIWNGSSEMAVGFEDGCNNSNPTCSEAILRSTNAVNSIEPILGDPAHGVWQPAPDSPLRNRAAMPLPTWSFLDVVGVPTVTPSTYGTDRGGTLRVGAGHPGAYEP
ncbi:MAG: right-handed parallel beta-helix repeat-containing protein [Microthrixaceae bacterium]